MKESTVSKLGEEPVDADAPELDVHKVSTVQQERIRKLDVCEDA